MVQRKHPQEHLCPIIFFPLFVHLCWPVSPTTLINGCPPFSRTEEKRNYINLVNSFSFSVFPLLLLLLLLLYPCRHQQDSFIHLIMNGQVSFHLLL